METKKTLSKEEILPVRTRDYIHTIGHLASLLGGRADLALEYINQISGTSYSISKLKSYSLFDIHISLLYKWEFHDKCFVLLYSNHTSF